MTNPLIEQGRGFWPYILESSGIDASFLRNKHGSCPMCGGEDRFKFDDLEGRGTYICSPNGAGCGAGDGFQLLRRYHGWTAAQAFDFLHRLFHGEPEHIRQILQRTPLLKNNFNQQESPGSKLKKLALVWSQSQPITSGDPVDLYLQARKIKLPHWPKDLHYHPNLAYYDNEKRTIIDKFPAMLALVRDHQGQPVTIHRTYLGNGCKADVPRPKKLMPSVEKGASSGGAIRLYPPTKDGKLCLAEGIETALAMHIATELPVWATVSAGGMERVVLPPEIKKVIIAVDNDNSGTGQKAAAQLAYRLLLEGRRVQCVMPPDVGDDFSDLLLKENKDE